MALLSCFVAAASMARGDEILQAAEQLHAKYAASLAELAAWCDKKGLAEQAKATRERLGPSDPYKLYVPVLPTEVGPPALPADAPADVAQWDARLWRLRRDQAGALYELARRAVRNRRASLAYDLALAAIRENPNHEPVRRLLGYQKYRGGWYTLYEARRLRAGHIWHEKFGWLPKAFVRRYEQGERFQNGRWISSEEDARLHRDVETGWLVESEHYSIRTNHSLEAGVALGVKLERLCRLWQQIFLRYYASQSDVIALFEGRASGQRSAPPPFHVVYFRDREDYNRALRAAMPNIGMSIGVYVEQTRRAYFFAGKDADDRTLYHEATHQLFHESRPVAPDVGRRGNFWIVEGIAMYMESLRKQGEYYVLGGFDDERMVAARYRLMHDGFYVPFDELAGYSMAKVQSDKRIATLYSQMAGLTSFLVYYDGGRYRDALVDYLTAVYTGRDDAGTLAQLTGTGYAELDKQYRQFMESGAATEGR